MQGGYAAGVQVTVNVNLDSKKGLKAVEFNGGVQQVSHIWAYKNFKGLNASTIEQATNTHVAAGLPPA